MKKALTIMALVAGILAVPAMAHAAGGGGVGVPNINISMGSGNNPKETVAALRILILFTVLSLAPAILIMMTSFTRIVVVLSFLRQALATQNMPPNQVIIGLSLFLTFFVMAPVWQDIQTNALTPFMEEKIDQTTAISRAEAPIRQFMFSQVREKDLGLFIELGRVAKPKTRRDVPTWVLIPTFEVELEHASGTVAVVVPYQTLEPIKEKLNAGFQPEGDRFEKVWTSQLRHHLSETQLNCRVDLGETSLTVGDLVNLNIGDIIPLTQDADGELDLCVENTPKFKCRFGVSRGNRAIQVTRSIDD